MSIQSRPTQSHPLRGDLYWVNFDPVVGSEQGGRRPAVVVSPNALNSTLPVVVVAAITKEIKDRNSPIAPVLPAGEPLRLESQVLTFQIRTVSRERLDGPVGTLTGQQLDAVARGMALVFGLQAFSTVLWQPGR